MARPKSQAPTYKRHKPSNTARTWYGGRWVSLGPYNSPESKEAFRRILAEHAASSGASPRAPTSITVDEMLLQFWRHVEQHYRTPEGEPTTEVEEIRRSIVPLRRLYGATPAGEFGPRAYTAVRQEMIDAGWCRTLINRRMERIKRAFRWASSQELVGVAVYQALRSVAGLQKGRTAARESEPVKPVDAATVRATLPYLSRHVRAMAELQLYTGMRPGEVCGLTFAEVEFTADLWVYRPQRHKSAHRGKERVVFFGPKAREVLTTFLIDDKPPPEGFAHINLNDSDQSTARLVMADAYQEAGREHDANLLRDLTKMVASVSGCIVDPSAPVFSPVREQAERLKRWRAARKSKVPPSQQNRRKMNPERQPSEMYHPHAFSTAIAKACEREGIEHWHPNMLRHTRATEVRKKFGVEGAQVALGHAHAAITEVYAERDQTLAAKIATEMG